MLRSSGRHFKHGRVCVEIAHESERHKNNSRIGGEQPMTLPSFGFVACGNEAGKAEASQSKQQVVMKIPLLPQDDATPRSQPSLKGHVTKDNVLKAETLWTLKLITSHYSFNSSKDTSQLFSAMFPDSQIAWQFACREQKAGYCCLFGLAEHFKSCSKTASVDLLLYCLMKD